MKLLIMHGSYRKNGNTGTIVKLLQQHLTEEAKKLEETVDIEVISFSEQQIEVCKGCRACFDHSEQSCPQKDDVLKLYETMKQADGIILGSPVYVEDVTGSMKNWIDRMAFSCHRPFLSGKPVLLFVTSGAKTTNHAVRTMGAAISAWGGVIAGSSYYQMGELMSSETAKRRFGEKIRRQSILLLQAVKNGKPSLYSLVAFTIQQMYWRRKEDDNSVDYRYWKEHGWLEQKCYYYDSDSKRGLRLHMARILGLLAGRYYVRD